MTGSDRTKPDVEEDQTKPEVARNRLGRRVSFKAQISEELVYSRHDEGLPVYPRHEEGLPVPSHFSGISSRTGSDPDEID